MREDSAWKVREKSVAVVTVTARSFLESLRAGALIELRQEATFKKLAQVVFAYWAARLNHMQAIYDRKRETRIMARLREGRGDWGILCYAVDGARKDDFLMGRDGAASRRYDGVETIFRDRSQVERLAELCPRFRAGELHPLVVKYRAGL